MEAKLVEKKLWMWRAWSGPQSKLRGKVMICDDGIVWAETLDLAARYASKVSGGPHHAMIKRISVEPVWDPSRPSVQIAAMMDSAQDGTETLDQLATLADNAPANDVS